MSSSTIALADPAEETSAPPAWHYHSVVLAGRVLLLIVLLALWQLATHQGWLDPFIVSTPLEIGERLIEITLSGRLFTDLSVTLLETFLGLALGSALGIAVGAALTFGKLIPEILDPFIMALYGLPRVALAPLFIVWFGIGIGSKVAVATSMVFFVTLLSTNIGMRQTDLGLLNAIKALGATKRQLLLKVRVPYAIPWIIAGLKTGVGMALIGTIVGEFIASSEGIGWYLSWAGGQFDSTGVMAGVMVLIGLSYALNAMIKRLEARLLNWKPDISL